MNTKNIRAKLGDEGRDARYELRLAEAAYENSIHTLRKAQRDNNMALARLTAARERCMRLGV